MIKSLIVLILVFISSCDFARRRSVAPSFDPFSVFSGIAESKERGLVNKALEKYSCKFDRVNNITTYRFTGDASRSSHYVNPWSIVSTMGGGIKSIYVGKSSDNDILVISKVKGLSGESLFATIYLCAFNDDMPEKKFVTKDLLAPNFYTTGTLGLYHNERSCDFDGAEVNSYICLDDSAFSMENSPPCPPGLVKMNIRFSGICH